MGWERRRKAWWRRRHVWIALLAAAGGLAFTLWLIQAFSSHRPPE
jgi:hypothetical protein